MPIYARIRLDEYMEIGQEAGEKEIANDTRKAVPLVGGDINDVSTWQTYIPGETEIENYNEFDEYWTWTLGNDSVDGRYYMPTFDKNKDSLTADINGTYEGTVEGDIVHYDDYVAYDADSKETASEFYDWDSDTNHEDGVNIAYDNGGVKAYDETMPIDDADVQEKASEEHSAQQITKTASVITMQQWIDEGSQPGDYWVYDTDGWAYWANPIAPGETTGLLLDGINMHKVPDDNWYYGINVVGQFVTKADISGFTSKGDSISDDALDLLSEITGIGESFVIEGPGELALGKNDTYKATLKTANVQNNMQPETVTWELDIDEAYTNYVKLDTDTGYVEVYDGIIPGTTFDLIATGTMEDGRQVTATKTITVIEGKSKIVLTPYWNDTVNLAQHSPFLVFAAEVEGTVLNSDDQDVWDKITMAVSDGENTFIPEFYQSWFPERDSRFAIILDGSGLNLQEGNTLTLTVGYEAPDADISAEGSTTYRVTEMKAVMKASPEEQDVVPMTWQDQAHIYLPDSAEQTFEEWFGELTVENADEKLDVTVEYGGQTITDESIMFISESGYLWACDANDQSYKYMSLRKCNRDDCGKIYAYIYKSAFYGSLSEAQMPVKVTFSAEIDGEEHSMVFSVYDRE